MGALKVGELVAELDLEDNLEKKLEKAEANFKSTAKGMDADAKIDLDVTRMMRKLDQMEAEVKDTTAMIDRETPTIDGSKLGDGIKSGLGKAEGAVSQAGAKMGDVLTAGIAGGVALGGAFIVDAFGKSLEREAGTAKLGIQLGLPPELAKALGAEAGTVYAAGFGENLGQVNDAMRFIVQNMGGLGSTSQSEFEEMTKGVLTVSSAFDQDLNKVTAAAGTLMKTGLAKNGKEALDIITRGLQSPANKADDLLDTFIEYSTQFRQLGLTGPQALGLLSQGLAGGARDADTVADALKEFAIRAQDGSTTSATAFATIGVNAAEMSRIMAQGGPPAQSALTLTMQKIAAIEDPAVRSQTAVALFGTKAEDLQGALGSLNTQTAVEQVGNVEGAMNRATTATDTQASRVEAWKRGLEQNVVGFIDTSVIPAFGRLADKYHEIFGEDSGESLRQGANKLASGPGGDAWAQGVIQATPVGAIAKSLGWFDDGGMVQGPIGSPQLIVAHGGETIHDDHKTRSSAPSVTRAGRPAGRRRDVTVVKVGTAELARVERKHDRAVS